jgi:hypothetical protein
MLFESEEKRNRAFVLGEYDFTYKGNSYSFDEIAHLFLSYKKTTHLYAGVRKTGETDSVDLQLVLTSGVKIKLSVDEEVQFLIIYTRYTKKKEDINNILSLFEILCRRTFSNRAKYYIRQLNDSGYFVYDGCYFYPPNKIVCRSKEFFLANSRFLKGSGYIEMRPKEDGIADKVSRGLARELSIGKVPRFNTQTDPDVIFFLLDKYFYLKWS